ncbi:hypothetical protein ACWEP4_30655 [Streptomyces sp. NPDC004227]
MAQFAAWPSSQRCGTRYLTTGKVIWAKQPPADGQREVMLPLPDDLDR